MNRLPAWRHLLGEMCRVVADAVDRKRHEIWLTREAREKVQIGVTPVICVTHVTSVTPLMLSLYALSPAGMNWTSVLDAACGASAWPLACRKLALRAPSVSGMRHYRVLRTGRNARAAGPLAQLTELFGVTLS
jgi:hypothetical protein